MDIFVKRSTAGNKREIIHELVRYLSSTGYVMDSYEDAIHKRELEFPTALELEGPHNVAIPHAETEHVKKSAIAVGILKDPIQWECMEDPEVSIFVHLVFLLAIENPEMVVPNLSAMTENVFSKPDLIQKIATHDDFEEIQETLKSLITPK
ncbi:MAG: PTS sugar transporter subunit IIA [Candidatus Heimdallarchaeota archaeon]